MGIALCHFEQSCRALDIVGHFEVRDDAPAGKKAIYVISWKLERVLRTLVESQNCSSTVIV
ncbi:MAG: hypothetical protein ACK5IQ_11215 [Bacteroidales bacterium]